MSAEEAAMEIDTDDKNDDEVVIMSDDGNSDGED